MTTQCHFRILRASFFDISLIKPDLNNVDASIDSTSSETDPLKILLVEDDESFRDILKTLLAKVGFDISVAQDGKIAQSILTLHTFDLIISDIQMPNMDGLALLKWVKGEKNIPVILMTGFSEIVETKEAYALGANEFLPKPFKQEDLLLAIEVCREKPKKKKNEGEQNPEDSPDHEYCKLSIEDFISGREIPFSIFIRLSDSKYVKVAYKGEDISLDRVRDYREKGVEHLYLKLEDFQAYLRQSLKIAKALTQTKKIAKKKKLHFVKHAGEVIQERLFVADVDQRAFSDAKDFVHSALSIASEDEDVVCILELLEDHADFLYAHSLGVSLYSVMIAKKAQWHSLANRYRISMAGLLHDVGKKEIDRKVLEKKRIQLTQAERALIETHPMRGQEIISEIKSIPPDLAQIVYQHHEDCNGYGFPNQLLKEKIHPMSRLLAVVDTFCNYVLPGPEQQGVSGTEAITQMLQVHQDRLDGEYLSLLMQAFPEKRKTRRR